MFDRRSDPHPTPRAGVICGHCGVIAPDMGASCSECNQPLSAVRRVAPSSGPDLYWVAVKTGFTCNQCKFLAPLDGLDDSGAVECAHCSLRQRFEVSEWSTALEFAHTVGDLAGPDPEGRTPHTSIWIGSENDYVKVGVTHTFVEMTRPACSVHIEAAPGHPVCGKCHAPLAVTVGADGAVATTCSTCGDRAAFTLPKTTRALYPALVAAIADDHRTDRLPAQPMATRTGVFALQCPGCGAPLQLDRSEKIATCAFCQMTSIVAHRNLSRARNVVPEPHVFWLLFRGPSPERGRLESEAVEPAPSATARKVGKLLKAFAKTDTIGSGPGVYEAPEQVGRNWPQVALTLVLGGIAVLIGYLVAGR